MTEDRETPEELETRRILGVLRSNASIRAEVQRALLTEELLKLPERFAEFATAAIGHFGALHEAINGLHTEVGAVKNDLGDLKGDLLEDTIRSDPDEHLYDHITGSSVLRRAQIRELSQKASMGLTVLSSAEARALQDADVVLVGRHPDTGKRLSAVVEASARIGRSDIERARSRADIMSNHGHTCLAIVATRYPPEDRWAQLAAQQDVIVVVLRSRANAA